MPPLVMPTNPGKTGFELPVRPCSRKDPQPPKHRIQFSDLSTNDKVDNVDKPVGLDESVEFVDFVVCLWLDKCICLFIKIKDYWCQLYGDKPDLVDKQLRIHLDHGGRWCAFVLALLDLGHIPKHQVSMAFSSRATRDLNCPSIAFGTHAGRTSPSARRAPTSQWLMHRYPPRPHRADRMPPARAGSAADTTAPPPLSISGPHWAHSP